MTFPFTQPSGGGGFFKPAEHENHLVLITQVHKVEDRFDSFKEREIPAATVDLIDLDDPVEELRKGILITHTGIVNRLSAGAHMVLGRIGKAPTKNGFEAWVLAEFDPNADPARAQAWLDKQNSGAPAAQPQQQTPAPQAAPAPASAPQQQAPATQGMADPSDPAVQALLASLQRQ